MSYQPVTCPRCDAHWGGHRAEHCASCHLTFTGTEAGDKHRTGKHGVTSGDDRRRCRSVDEMRALVQADGTPWYREIANSYGTILWGRNRQDGRW